MKIAIVTGASSGMGRELLRQLPDWEKYDEIWAIARRAEQLESLKEEISLPIRPIPMDLTAPDSRERYRDLLRFAHPQVDLLANVSGFGKFGSYRDIPLDDSLNMIDLNVKALVWVTEETIPYLGEEGKILQWDSMSAIQPVPYLNVYAATKAFVLSYSRALNRELAPTGRKCMAVCPYWVKTPFFDRARETNAKAVTVFNRTYEAKDVVHTALNDLFNKHKDVSVHGRAVKWQWLLVKLLPHKIVMNTWLKQQKKA